jgi:tripartite-type tricarboxylate transporter receptor subunit TctC
MRLWTISVSSAAVIVSAVAGNAAWAQSGPAYPTRPIRIVAPFGAGGLVDVLARAVGEKMRASLGQPVIVDNRPGSGGNIGADIVARAEPDGYTLLMSSAGILSINEALYPKMPFNPQTAFTPVSLVAEMNMLAVVNSGSPIKNASDLIAAARKEPGKLNFGSPGNGTTGHLGMELFQYAAKVKLTHVPYKSAAEAVLALSGNQIQGVFDNPPTVLPHIRAGRLRALAYAAPKRFPLLPDVPTFDESALKGFEASSWFGLVAPAKTPRAVANLLAQETAKALREPDVQKRFADLGATLVGNTPDQFGTFIRAETRKWHAVVKAADIKLQ